MSSYELIRVVGEGATAVSHLAKDEHGREVLVKRFKTAFYKQENDFKREVQVLCGLVHPQIPQYIDSYVEKVDGRSLPHIVQEYIHGTSLEEYFKSHRPSHDEVLDWIAQLLGVLSYLHALRPPVIHRDIKPSNILLRDGQVVLIDFGLAVDAQIRTMGHSIAVGTLGYQAPEQISGSPTIQSDLYSVGALAVELLTGRSPSTMLDGMRLRWQEKCMDLPTNFQRWLDKMLAMEQDNRFQDAADAIRGLPQLEKKVKVIQSAIRKPTDVDVSDDFMAMLAKKKEEKRKMEEAERRVKLEAQEAKRHAQEKKERQRIEVARAKRDAEQHRQEMREWIHNEEAALIAELEAAWDAGVPEVVGQRLDAEDLIAAMNHSFGHRSPIVCEEILHDVVHPLYLLATKYVRDGENVATLAYRKWVVDNKSSQWEKEEKTQRLREALRMKKLEIAEKEKEIGGLGWFAGLFQKGELKQKRKAFVEQKNQIQAEIKKERKEFVQSCLDVYWRPWFGSDVERWVRQEFQDVQSYVQKYQKSLSSERERLERERLKQERLERERLEREREIVLLDEQREAILAEQKKKWKARGKDIPSTFDFVGIPAGSFMMGALPSDGDVVDREKPRHKVTLSKGFWMGKYPCTQELYESVMGANPSAFEDSTRPVERVSWCDAVLFCNKLSEIEGLEPAYVLPQPFENDNDWSKKVKWNKNANGYRLLTEAEWEYCARAGQSFKYSGSNNIDEVGWYSSNSGSETHPVGQKKANGFGLNDMSGNVWEWVWDSWKREYGSSTTDPVHIDMSSPRRVYRGGGWSDDAGYSRVSYRGRYYASYRDSNRGFRFLRTIP